MSDFLANYRIFFREFRSNFHTTGAILPSGRWLGRSLSRYVRQDANNGSGGRKILEVGPGTGAVTKEIVRALGSDDRFDLVELNDAFVAQLRQRFQSEPLFQKVADRSTVFHQPVQELTQENHYDVIVSGLPLNNFSPELVQSILQSLIRLLKPGGTVSFFEYIAIRNIKQSISKQKERERLRAVTTELDKILKPYEIRRDWIWPNIPPAWVHHVRIDR